MAYALELAIPKDTAKASPVSDYVYMTHCVVSRVELTFPDGCAGLVGVRFCYQTRQLWPANPEGWFRGNGQTVIFQPMTRVDEEPAQLFMQAYNLDDTFEHTVFAVIGADFEGASMSDLIAAMAAQGTSGALPGIGGT